MMYEELVKELRYLAKVYSICENENMNEYRLAVQAADAIEELSKLADAIPHVCECCVGCELEKKNGGCDHGFVLSPKLAMQYLIKPRWIPVTEQLPEENGDYIVYCVGGNYNQTSCISLAYFGGEHFYVDLLSVTHWMPLPEPPKGDE